MYSLLVNYKLSDRCDLQCESCQLWPRETEEEFPALELIRADLQLLKKRGTRIINFTGGDPLLHPDIVEITRLAKGMGFFIVLTTPGIHYTAFPAGFKGTVDLLVFVLHGHERQLHDERAGLASFDRIRDAINFAKEQGQRVMISYALTRETVQSIPEMYELTSAHNVILWLNPLPETYGVAGFDAETLRYIRYQGRKPLAWVNLAALRELVRPGKGKIMRQDCLAVAEEQAKEHFGIAYLLNIFSWGVLLWKLLHK
jgi:MoaA/NifB/PqqE/SkfB family radical SAM enzyme